MDQSSRSPPPPYSQEYSKPPPYFEPGNGAGGPSAAVTGQPQAHQYHPQQGGWYPPAPSTEQSRNIQTENVQQSGTRPTVITVTSAPAYVTGQQQVLILGNCPSCRIGFLRNEFDICGIILAILFFPIGVLCCLCMMEKRCSHCGARF